MWRVLVLCVLAACGRLRFDATQQDVGDDAAGSDADGGDGGVAMRQLAIGWVHACVIEIDGRLRCWGNNGNSQLGVGLGPDELAPVDAATGLELVAAGAGQDHACALLVDGSIQCWGADANGQLGRSPSPCGNMTVDSGETCDDGGWANGDGCTSLCQSGPFPPDATAPTPIEASRQYRALNAKRFSTCAVATDGTLWCWGRNGARQLGIGDNGDRGRPFQVLVVAPQTGPDDQWAQVELGSDHTCARQLDGSLWCWGADGFGSLAQGASPYVRERPNRVVGSWLDVASGTDFSCGIQTDGSAWCWGLNDVYQLGLGDVTNRFVPTLVDAGPFVGVGAGGGVACAFAASGAMKCWGSNGSGQVGVGTTGGSIMTPTTVAGDWVDMAGGSFFSCGLRRDGEVYCWGSNTNGRLGDGTGTDSAVPVRVLL